MTPLAALLLCVAMAQGDDPSTRLEKLNAKAIDACVALAGEYDANKDPEAAHFFAECALGLGAKDDKITALRKKWEDEVYYGRSRGGQVLADAKPIDDRMAPIARQARDLLDELVRDIQRNASDSQPIRSLAGRTAVLHELARGASDYVRAVQRFNALRAKMKLRALLWEFEPSSRLMIGAWYMCETGDTVANAPDTKAASFTDHVAFARDESNRSPNCPVALRDYADRVRSFGLMREDLLNPDARRLWLGWWNGGVKLKCMALYAVPRAPYRKDIPTPSAKSRGETVVEERDRWQDIEEVMKVGSTSVPVSQYPYAGESDAPTTFGGGAGDEAGWSDPVVERKGLYSFGLPIMLRFFGGKDLTEVEFELKPKGGRPVSCRRYLNGDKRVDMANLPTVLLLPERPLDKGTTYEVRIKGKFDRTPFERNWEFTTGK
jgi:hypothetical protein